MRDLYATIRNFRTRVADFIRYRRVTTNMNEVSALASAASAMASLLRLVRCRNKFKHSLSSLPDHQPNQDNHRPSSCCCYLIVHIAASH